MHPITERQFNAYVAQMARINGVDRERVARGGQFTVSPEVEQRVRAAVQQSNAFLQLTSFQAVDNQSGEVIDIGTSSSIAGRTDTSSGTERTPVDPTGKVKDAYSCVQTDYDVSLRYDALDAWRHLPNFQQLWSQAVAVQTGLDKLTIGFNGTSAAATTNRVTNPLLQDVNVGWLQKMRTGNAARWVAEGAETGELRVGAEAGADYRNLDELVMSLAGNVHDQFYQDPRMRVILGRDLLQDKYLTFQGGSSTDAPTEQAAIETLMLNKRVGGYPAMVAPFFPPRAILLTIPANLVVIEQRGTRRRMIRDYAPLSAVQDFNSQNEAFGIGRYEAAAGCENVTYFGEGTWTE